MNQLTLEWVEAGQVKTVTIADQQPSKALGVVRLGRDPARCDVVFTHPTVSGLHIEISFHPGRQQFEMRNLRESNPPLVNWQTIPQEAIAIQLGMVISLGQVNLTVKSIAIQPASRPIASTPAQTYGLRCQKCHHVSAYDRLRMGCPWCGMSLAGADSVLMVPESR